MSYAFVPDPLPPKWQWPADLWPNVVRAKESLARLEGVAKHLPSSANLLLPLLGREARSSSTMEGTYSEPEQVALFELEPEQPKSRNDPANSNLEVLNHFRALRFAEEARRKIPLSLRLIREIHGVLFGGVVTIQGPPGEFRRLQNAVGRPPRYVPPPPNLLPECLDAFEKYIHEDRVFDPLVDAFLVHYQFEAIHPFRDGNGRVGRILLTVMIAEWCGLSGPWLLMSPYFDRHRDEYQDLLLGISLSGGWRPWIEFCLRGVVEQSKDGEAVFDRLLAVEKEHKARVIQASGNSRLTGIIDKLIVSPVVTVTQVVKDRDVSYATARADLEKLVEFGVLVEIPGAKQRAFYAPRIIEATYGSEVRKS